MFVSHTRELSRTDQDAKSLEHHIVLIPRTIADFNILHSELRFTTQTHNLTLEEAHLQIVVTEMQIKFANSIDVVQGLQAISKRQPHSVHIDTSVVDLQTKFVDLTNVVKTTAHFNLS